MNKKELYIASFPFVGDFWYTDGMDEQAFMAYYSKSNADNAAKRASKSMNTHFRVKCCNHPSELDKLAWYVC